ncbi:MAG: DUF4013 domain-containing protein [Thaumarchaeota archaeon]|jgi:hypothetical protein|nr:DUF4013 domain-containing protein [Candidatus Terraquivivens yellowstonensis]MCL7393160.1 DUF4013 domain-containing protein [Candidatus Terraquivivens yellowstonensis]
MKLEDNLRDSYNYTIKLFKDIGRLIILIILDIIPIVNFIVSGYFARVVRESPRSDAPPPLENYGELWINGAKIFVAMLVYMIVPIGLMAAGAVSSVLGAFMPLRGLGVLGTIMTVAGIILAFIILIIAIMAITHMAKTGKLGDAFDFNRILSVIKNVGWSNYILWVIVIFVIGLVLTGISYIPYVGWILALIISPVFMVFVGRSASIVYESGTTQAPVAPTTVAGVRYCGYCGNPLGPEDKFCGKCGRPVK